MIKAPFTPDQVLRLNQFQHNGNFHPFTCGGCNNPDVLVATESGWICRHCDYTQDWAHEGMAAPYAMPALRKSLTQRCRERGRINLDNIKDQQHVIDAETGKRSHLD